MRPPARLEPSVPVQSAGWLPPAAAVTAASACLALTSCLLDLSVLRGGKGDGGPEPTTGAGADASAGAGAGGGCSASVVDCNSCNVDCSADGCAPRKLAAGPSTSVLSPRGITATSDALYWVNQEGNNVMALVGGDPMPKVMTKAEAPTAIIADKNGNIFWVERTGIWRCPLSDCSDQSKVLVVSSAGDSSIKGIALDEQTIFWTDQGAAPTQNQGVVKSCEVSMCASPLVLAKEQPLPLSVTASVGKVFWSIQGATVGNGEVRGASKNAVDKFVQIASGLPLPIAIAMDGLRVYWTHSGEKKVRSCVNDAAANFCPTGVVEIATAQDAPSDLAVSGGTLYWTGGDGYINSCPASGCGLDGLHVHVKGPSDTQRLALNLSCLFWTENGGIFKLPRN